MLEAFESREGGRRRGGLGGGRRGGKNSSAVSVEVGGENGESDMEYLRGDRETGERNDKIKRWDGMRGYRVSSGSTRLSLRDATGGEVSNDADTQKRESLGKSQPAWLSSPPSFPGN